MKNIAKGLLLFRDGDMVQIIASYKWNKTMMHELQIVASNDGREGGHLRLTQSEMDLNVRR